MKKLSYFSLLISLILFAGCTSTQTPTNNKIIPCFNNKYFKIKVVDEETGRGVPMIQLKTVSNLIFMTDSNGIAAFYEPGLMNQTVYFHVEGHGYEYQKDWLGYRGKKLTTLPGKTEILKIKRINIAQRIYRVTGEGIYRDSVLAGESVSLKNPVLNGEITGQDSVLQELYKGKLFWIWGDTNRVEYPLGHFSAAGAQSELPRNGGLDPNLGVDLNYFEDENGFSKKIAPFEEKGMIWLDSLMTVKDKKGNDRLVSKFNRMKSLGEKHEHGWMVFDDTKKVFTKINNIPLNYPVIFYGHPTRLRIGNKEWFYAAFPFHAGLNIRVPNSMEKIIQPESYEVLQVPPDATKETNITFAKWEKAGKLFGNDPGDYKKLQKKNHKTFKQRALFDIDTGERISLHGGSVYWNDYRQKWICIFLQIGGEESLIGNIWYAESDTPTGPWGYAKKIVTHNKYSFYNVKHHPYFDQEGGKIIYFEGTYTMAFSQTKTPTPRYDYNQIMYKLDLNNSKLFLPEPVYLVDGEYLFGKDIKKKGLWEKVDSIAFYACTPERSTEDLTPVYKGDGNLLLEGTTPYLMAPKVSSSTSEIDPVVPLFETTDSKTKKFHYSSEQNLSSKYFGQVWKNPQALSIIDLEAKP